VSEAINIDLKISEEEQVRSDMYNFLSGVLQCEPNDNLIKSYEDLKGDQTPVGQSFSVLSDLACKLSPVDIRSEYQNLFIGVGRGELLPFGSFYITGFLHDKPLAALKRDLNAMGIQRASEFKEPEDHIACLCEVMSGLILGNYGKHFSIAEQRSFYKKHILPWAEHFFTDLEGAKSAIFYSPVGTIGKLFMKIEDDAFAMDASR
jgi:TorA maturation chaperone TorD